MTDSNKVRHCLQLTSSQILERRRGEINMYSSLHISKQKLVCTSHAEPSPAPNGFIDRMALQRSLGRVLARVSPISDEPKESGA